MVKVKNKSSNPPTKQTRKVEGGVTRKRKIRNLCDATEILTWIAITMMLYRIVYLLRVYRTQKESSNTDLKYKMKGLDKEEKGAAREYSKMKGIRSSSGRTFLKYTSSRWEDKWSSFIDLYQKMDVICSQVKSDSDLISVFFNATCTSIAMDDHIKPEHRGWCKIDDGVQPVFYNQNNQKVSGSKPATLTSNDVEFTQNRPIIIADRFFSVFSRFTFRDDTTGFTYHEYIEPLVNRMRHPLDCCEGSYKMRANFKKGQPDCKYTQRLGVSRTQYIPPHPDHVQGYSKRFYFDSGSHGWNRGPTGPSFGYFLNIWRRHSIEFDRVFAYEPRVEKEKIISKIPQDILTKFEFHDDADEKIDLLAEIIKKASKDDYVLLKLDLGSPERDLDVIDRLLQNQNNIQDYVDEFFYAFPVPEGNLTDRFYGPWYKRFIALREAGIRAHSWV